MNEKLVVDRDRITDFCRRHHITRLAIFGSALRDDFRADTVGLRVNKTSPELQFGRNAYASDS